MKVSDILRIKGTTLYTTTPLAPLAEAVQTMADHDLGSILVMDHGDLVGILTFREVILALNGNGGALGQATVRSAMDDHPLTCSPDTELDEVRRMMLERHARYLPVLNKRDLMGGGEFLRCGQSRGGQPKLREPNAQGLYTGLALRRRGRQGKLIGVRSQLILDIQPFS